MDHRLKKHTSTAVKAIAIKKRTPTAVNNISHLSVIPFLLFFFLPLTPYAGAWVPLMIDGEILHKICRRFCFHLLKGFFTGGFSTCKFGQVFTGTWFK
jgi:hypothetical protein